MKTFLKPLTPSEEREYLRRLREGERSARDVLIERNMRLVAHIVKKYSQTDHSQEDLISIGTVGLIKAVETFDPERAGRLGTYAAKCIDNEILMFLRKIASQRTEVSLDEPLNTDWDGNELLLSDVLGTDEDEVSRPLEDDVDRQLLLEAVDRLCDREKTIITLRFGLRGAPERTQKEVADMMGISQSYISRLEKRIILRLRRDMTRSM